LERYDTSKIKTVSYGTPGLLDYDVGCMIAKHFGLEHHAVDLSKKEFNWNDLLKSVEEAPWTYVPDGYFNRLAISEVVQSEKDVVLSGFLGEAITGGHFSNTDSVEAATKEFTWTQRREKNQQLFPVHYDPESALPEVPKVDGVEFSELLDFGVRQSCCIAPIVTPVSSWSGWGGDMGRMPASGVRVLAPFAHPLWASYWLQASKEKKMNQALYLDMLKYKFPRLSVLPSKYTLGVSPNKKNQMVAKKIKMKIDRLLNKITQGFYGYTNSSLNYLDFEKAFRDRDDYNEVLDQAFMVLRNSKAVDSINVESIRSKHLSSESDNSVSLLILVGLALNIINEKSRLK
jgi:hypothetical protein